MLESGQVVNADDETVGYIDLGKAILRDSTESFLASVTGVCTLYYLIIHTFLNEIADRMRHFVTKF